eukprot:CAMPEP_0194516980 /NCGR_PEP_ID=MMETSP0253-20130528/50021_1 /TAXON_ID=2966 /ORGANISM="Noctiluca scintillans" /LENGTH=480 /DNA_ID=CAMNT_0039360895 /DNA_START=32 /DNA_END=1474 /DNA_ORIENTATION=+
MALSCAAEACDCEPWKEKHQEAQGALAEGRNFEAVQLVNASLEAYESLLKDADVQTGLLASDSSRFVQDARSKLSESQAVEIADIYTTRAEVLMALGGLGRALTELKSSLLLAPGNERATRLNEHCAELQAATKEAVKEWETDEAAKKVPVYMLTGFLGSGKTTLLNHILNDMHGKKLAVIENEFGEIGIDDALIATRQDLGKEHILEMNNGCICCTVRGDLIKGLKSIHKRTRGDGQKLDGIIIETTGLADPAPVAQTFFADDYIQARMMLDGIITVVDAKHFLQHVREEKPEGVENETVEQIAFADRILVNKVDLVTEEILSEVEAEIRNVNKVAPIFRTQDSKIDLSEIIGTRSFSLDKVLELDGEFLRDDQEHMHDNSVTSVGIECEGECQLESLNAWFATLLKEKGVDIFRMKGVLNVKNSENRFVFQGIHMIFAGQPQSAWAAGEPRLNKLVFIGRNLDRDELVSGFKSNLASA